MNKASVSVRELCLYSLLGALMYVAKMILAGLPNVELVSLFVMVLAVVSGWKGLWSVYAYVFLEYCTWGLNIWSLSYLYIWLILYAAARFFHSMNSVFGWAWLAGLFGLCFGAFSAIPYIVLLGWNGALSWWMAGIPFDLVHGISNFLVSLFLFLPLKNGLARLIKAQSV